MRMKILKKFQVKINALKRLMSILRRKTSQRKSKLQQRQNLKQILSRQLLSRLVSQRKRRRKRFQ